MLVVMVIGILFYTGSRVVSRGLCLWSSSDVFGHYSTYRSLILQQRRRLKRFRYRRNKKLHKSPKFFRRHALPYHSVQRCRRRGGNKPHQCYLWDTAVSFSRFQTRLSQVLLRRRANQAYYEEMCHRYVHQVFEDQAARYRDGYEPTLLDRTKDLGGVDEDIYTPFLNLHNPLTVHRPLQSDFITVQEWFEKNPPESEDIEENVNRYAEFTEHSTNLWNALDTHQAAYFRVAEFKTSHEGKHLFSHMPVIFDTGASIGLTPFRADFIDYQVLENVTVKDIARQNKVLGVGTVMWKFTTRLGREVFLPLVCYHVEHASIRLMSPQLYFKGNGGRGTISGNNVEFILPDNAIIDIPIDPKSNLPMVWNVSSTSEEQERIGPSLMGTTYMLHEFESYDSESWNFAPSTFDHPSHRKQASAFERCFPCVGDETNQQLTGPQKELLTWHWKLGINMQHCQELMHEQVLKLDDGTEMRRPAVLPTKNTTTKSCKIPMCMSCEMAKLRARSPRVKTSKAVKEKEGILSRGSYEPGDMVSSDQFNVHTAGRKFDGYGRESPENGFHGGTVYVDAASGLVRVEMQVSMGANETLIGKHKFEQWVYDLAAVCVKRYHSNNGVYDSNAFREDYAGQNQK